MSEHDASPIGWRARIGVITPAIGMAITADFHKVAPPGVTFLLGRVKNPLDEDTVEALEEVGNYAPAAAEQLVKADPDVIVWNTTTGSLMEGIGYDEDLIAEMENATGVPSTTASTAMLQAFHEQDVETVSLALPYIDEVNQRVVRFLEDNDFEVVNYERLELLEVEDIINISPTRLYKLAKNAMVPDADAVFISCAGMSALDVIDDLEHDLNVPVMSTNQVSLWHAFQKAQVGEPIDGYGTLLSSH